MTTLLFVLIAGAVVLWVVAKAARTDRTDETVQFAHIQEIVGGWTDEASASQSRNDLANNG
jgi:hypothetical protein